MNATSAGGGCFPLRLDPRTKLVVMGVIAITELLNGSDYFTAAVAAIPILLLLQNRQLKIAVWYIVFSSVSCCGTPLRSKWARNSSRRPPRVNW